MIASSAEHDEAVLWFEHDLYDQLQLIQALDQLSRLDRGPARLSLICTDRYLGPMHPEELRELFPFRRSVSRDELETARQAWAAFRASSPANLLPIANALECALPFLPGAILRHLQEFPSLQNGLSRTQSQLLHSLSSSGEQQPHELFESNSRQEERIYLADVFFYLILNGLVTCPVPLIQPLVKQQPPDLLSITQAGRSVLAGHADHIALNGIDRWLGGVHLHAGSLWRWNAASRTITRTT